MNQTRTLPIEVHIVERETDTIADASIVLETGQRVAGHGTAYRHPRDPDIPTVGDELATARALSELAHRLVEAAAETISQREHRTVHLTR